MNEGARNLCIGCTSIVAILLTIILVPLSFSYLEYYEYGLVRVKTTGTIDTSKVYARGRYFLGVIKGFRTYKADAHYEELHQLAVFSNGESEDSIGLSFKIDVDFTFLLKKDEVGELHRDFASTYRDVIVSKAKEAIKNEAIFVTFSQYFEERVLVEQRFRDAVQKVWDTKPSVHCTLDQFHLGRIRIPESVAEKQMASKIQNELNDRESFLQQAQLERELTAVMVNSKLLEKDRTIRTAEAQASLARSKATSEAARITAQAQIDGIKALFEAAEISEQDDMTAFTYIRNLANRENIELDLSYLQPDSVIRTKPA